MFVYIKKQQMTIGGIDEKKNKYLISYENTKQKSDINKNETKK